MGGIVGALMLLPYVAIPLGSSGIPVAVLATVGLLCVTRWDRSDAWVLALPSVGWLVLGLSLLVNDALGHIIGASQYRSWIALVTIPVLVASLWLVRSDADVLLGIYRGVAVTVVLHAGIGLVQWLSFRNSNFPMAVLFELNPSYSATVAAFDTLATFVKRPMGWFPEPSVAGAAIGSWLPLLAFARRMEANRGAWSALHLVSMALGAALILVSKSGMIVLLVPVLATTWVMAQTSFRRKFWGSVLMLGAAALGIGYWVLMGSGSILPARFSLSTNESWQHRAESILLLRSEMFRPSVGGIFGHGPGAGLPESTTSALGNEVSTVYSVVGQFLLSSGIFGAALTSVAFVLVSSFVWDRRRRAQAPYSVAAIAISLLAVSVGISYSLLLATWAAAVVGLAVLDESGTST